MKNRSPFIKNGSFCFKNFGETNLFFLPYSTLLTIEENNGLIECVDGISDNK
jgi:hypothetical protein